MTKDPINIYRKVSRINKYRFNPNWHEALAWGLMDKAVGYGAEGPWFDPCLRHSFLDLDNEIGNQCMSGRGRPGMIPRHSPPLCIHDTLWGRPGCLLAVPLCRPSPFCYRQFPRCLSRVPWMSLRLLPCHPVRG